MAFSVAVAYANSLHLWETTRHLATQMNALQDSPVFRIVEAGFSAIGGTNSHRPAAAGNPLAVPNVRSLYLTRLLVDGLLSGFGVGSPKR